MLGFQVNFFNKWVAMLSLHLGGFWPLFSIRHDGTPVGRLHAVWCYPLSATLTVIDPTVVRKIHESHK